jgi:hypothetical protein
MNLSEPISSPSRLCGCVGCRYLVCEVEEKVPQLVEFLKTHARGQKCIVYFLTCACVDYWATVLPRLQGLKKLPITALHGKMKQVRPRDGPPAPGSGKLETSQGWEWLHWDVLF